MNELIPFNRPYMGDDELRNVAAAHGNGKLAGDGPFTKLCHRWLEEHTGAHAALLSHSCTAALEMSALLLDLEPGDEIILPSYTFVSTANAFVLRGAVPVFVDIRSDTLNLDETLLEAAITPRTRAIVPVHYAGVSCDMDVIMEVADRHGLTVVEDAAQGVMSTWRGRALGSIGQLGTYSFHETKNIISGEGGALLVNDANLRDRAEIIREKGTNRSSFFRGEVDKYTWQDVGSSFLPGELIAAFLWAQLEAAASITRSRMESWDRYHELLASLEERELLRRPIVPELCEHNAHMYYVLLKPGLDRQEVLSRLKAEGISAVFHYVPLHTSPVGSRIGRAHGDLLNTIDLSERIIRLPLWVGLTADQQQRIVDTLESAIELQAPSVSLSSAALV